MTEHLTRRTTLALATAALAITAPTMAWAQSDAIRLIVPFAPGGAVDQTGRTISGALGKALNTTVVVENKPGASGSLGALELSRAKPDGKTLMLGLDSQAVNHLIIKSLPFDTFKSFDYLSLLVTTPQVLVARNDIPARNLDELVAYLQAHPEASYGSAGTASAGHVNSAQLSLAKGLKNTHIPYKGAAPLVTDLLGGHIDYAFAGLSVMLPYIQAGKVRAIAVSSPQRSAKLPDVPAMKELIPGFEYPTWIGLVAPAGLPANTRTRLLEAIRKVMHDPEVVARLQGNAFDVVNNTPEEFTARVHQDAKAMGDLVQRKIIKAD
ncbi:tripartite tricarboxylate transporter substrate binding protein [Ottowia sp.]|uniref:Bug family tripartite tricarboxylate transporter substrate binding protein n=1 Tax=Ottowia sp. TaxID=1898956 RepID=UPI0026343D03|nr:tripartite tricarboxylate transporter substrate binding protein [Ottowia sp.]